MENIITFYKIICNITGEFYIGSTKNKIEIRLKSHKTKKDCMVKYIIERGNFTVIILA